MKNGSEVLQINDLRASLAASEREAASLRETVADYIAAMDAYDSVKILVTYGKLRALAAGKGK